MSCKMVSLAIFMFYVSFCVQISDAKIIIANSHRCVGATFNVASRGNGSDPNSCMSCDPTYPTCSAGCQSIIDNFYYSCDDICLPDGYFFDPKGEFSGCWKDVLFDMKIQVERCGCNSAPRSMIKFSVVMIVATLLSMFLL